MECACSGGRIGRENTFRMDLYVRKTGSSRCCLVTIRSIRPLSSAQISIMVDFPKLLPTHGSPVKGTVSIASIVPNVRSGSRPDARALIGLREGETLRRKRDRYWACQVCLDVLRKGGGLRRR